MQDMNEYMSAMNKVMANPGFMDMAQKLGQALMQDPMMSNMFQQMSNPGYQESMQKKIESLKDDPDMKDVLQDLETGGPSASAIEHFCFLLLFCAVELKI